MHEIIIERSCRIEPIGGGAPREMWITFFRPIPGLDEKLELRAQISSPFFRQDVLVVDEHPRALADLIDLVLAVLQNRCDEGYRIYFFNREELDVENFWRRGVNHDDILRNVILKRAYKICSSEDAEVSDLQVEVLRAYEEIDDSRKMMMRLTSKYFSRSFDLSGGDDFEALEAVQRASAIWMAHKVETEGLSLYLHSPGDLDPQDMWRMVMPEIGT